MSERHPLLTVDADGGVAVVTRDNPPVNALTLETTRELHAALAQLENDPSVHVVVITAAGRSSFGAGSDIAEFPEFIAEGNVVERKMAFENETFGKLARMPKPTIAALNGSAYGGGLEIALACDLIIAEAGQVVALPEVHLGLFPSSGGPLRLVSRIGAARTKEMVFFGGAVGVERAAEWGLVNRVVQPGAALGTALDWGKELAGGSVSGLQAAKRAINTAVDGLGEDAAIQESLALAREVFAHPDAAEGTAAFLEKRPAKFPSTQGAHT